MKIKNKKTAPERNQTRDHRIRLSCGLGCEPNLQGVWVLSDLLLHAYFVMYNAELGSTCPWRPWVLSLQKYAVAFVALCCWAQDSFWIKRHVTMSLSGLLGINNILTLELILKNTLKLIVFAFYLIYFLWKFSDCSMKLWSCRHKQTARQKRNTWNIILAISKATNTNKAVWWSTPAAPMVM